MPLSSRDEVRTFYEEAGFRIDSRSVNPVEGFEMDALHIAATKNFP